MCLQPMDPCQDPAGDAGDRREVPKVRPGSTSWGVGLVWGFVIGPSWIFHSSKYSCWGFCMRWQAWIAWPGGSWSWSRWGLLRPAKSSSFGFGAYWVATVVLLCRTD